MALYFLASQPRFACRGIFDSILEDIDRIESAIVPMLSAVSQQREESAGKSAKVTDDDSKLAISLNVANFKPEELSVDLDGRILKVQGKQEIKEENGYSMRTFVRQWMLPDDVDVEQLKSSLTEDGHLALEAPKITKKSSTTRSIRIETAPAAVTNDDSKLAISLNVANFEPEELCVDLDGRILNVQSKQEIEEENGYA
ncbi:unnamed protein product [Cylicocyclus nassatus]|uniref:SHSP domain-containing protein n=1 Tax=Cylicocyclus nassatus TaxID=53992 RepID=A0AA36DJZ4_CYLNA|nr:unnamed protein product [Cylicocyclus nassatus]